MSPGLPDIVYLPLVKSVDGWFGCGGWLGSGEEMAVSVDRFKDLVTQQRLIAILTQIRIQQ